MLERPNFELNVLNTPSPSCADEPLKCSRVLCFLCSRFCPLCLSPNAVLRLRFNHFATECSWDHMYVYDGDSIYAPLIAVFR